MNYPNVRQFTRNSRPYAKRFWNEKESKVSEKLDESGTKIRQNLVEATIMCLLLIILPNMIVIII